MSFAEAAGVITQTGVDADLSGLTGVTGVTKTTLGTANNIITIYNLGTSILKIDGTLSHDPERERLVFVDVATGSPPIEIRTGGTYNFGKEVTANSVTRYSDGVGIINSKSLSNNGFNSTYSDQACPRVNGGTFVWKGGTIQTPSLLRCQDGNIDIYEGTIDCTYNTTTNQPTLLINSAADTVNIRNLKLIQSDPSTYRGPQFNFEKSPNIFDGVKLFHGTGIGTFGVTLSVVPVIDNFSPSGGLIDFTFWRQNVIKGVNFATGMEAVFGGMLFGSNGENRGAVELYKDVSFDLDHASGGSVDACKIFMRDTDDGNRPSDYTVSAGTFSWTADRTYTWNTNASGVAASQEVLLGCSVKPLGGAQFDGITTSYRGINSNNTDVFTFHIWSYLNAYSSTNQTLKGTGTLDVKTLLITDSLITETTLATVQAYTALETTAKLYDGMKNWKVNDSNIESPTISTTPLTRSMDTVEAGSFNLTIQAAAGSVFAFDGTTITAKASSFDGNITTTGVVTLDAIAEGRTIKSASSVVLAALPTALTLDNAVLTLDTSLNTTIDLSAWSLVNGASINVIGSTGTLTIITGGNTGWTITDNTTTGTLVREDGLITAVEVTGLTSANVLILDNLGATAQYSTNQTGTLNYNTPIGSTGSWKVTVDRIGYASQTFTFTADGGSKSFSGVLIELKQPSGQAMYAASSSAFLSVVPNPDGSRMNLRVGDGIVTAQQLFDEVEVALATEDGMKYLANGGGRVEFASLPTGTFVFMRQNVRLIRDTAGDVNATVEAFVQSTDGVVLDGTNGSVAFVTVSRAQQLVEYGDAIWVDTVSGTNNSLYPYGTQASPVNNWANAKILAEFYGINTIRFRGTMSLTSDSPRYLFIGNTADAIVALGGFDITSAAFRECIVTGNAATPSSGCQILQCYAENLTNYNGVLDQTILTGNITLTGERNYLTRCASAPVDDVSVTVTCSKAGQQTVSIRDWYGRLTIAGVSNALNTVSVDSDSGDIVIDASCTAGSIKVRGEVTSYVDNSAGATVTTAFTARKSDIDGLNNFNPATDTVAHVTLVDTVTTNTDMRGTDGANTVAPDNASIAAILVDTNELQTNQGNWITATGFATPANVTDAQAAVIAEVNANEAKIDLLETKAQADIRQAALIAEHDSTQAAIPAAAPTAAAVATQVRTELTTELARIDVAVSTRSSHSAPDLTTVEADAAAAKTAAQSADTKLDSKPTLAQIEAGNVFLKTDFIPPN